MFAVNPNADEVEGDPCCHDLSSIPEAMGSRDRHEPRTAEETMRDCAELAIEHVWMHRGRWRRDVSETAAAYGREHGVAVIDGGCPCMFGPTSDPGHKAMRLCETMSGNVPRRV